MKENQNIEFKEKWKDEYLKVIAANTNGGKLLIGINERQIKAVIFVKEKGKITNQEYRKINNISDRTALRDLNDLCNKNIFVGKGKTGRKTLYFLVCQKPDKSAINQTESRHDKKNK